MVFCAMHLLIYVLNTYTPTYAHTPWYDADNIGIYTHACIFYS